MSGAGPPSELKRALGLGALTFDGLGIILGAGIYSVIGAAAGRAGEGLWWSFLASGVVAFLTALSYAELATSYPQAGAEYVYTQHAFPRRPWLAFTIVAALLVARAVTAGVRRPRPPAG